MKENAINHGIHRGLCHIQLEGTKVFSLFLCVQSLGGFIESLDQPGCTTKNNFSLEILENATKIV
jgi:hypothetical protein